MRLGIVPFSLLMTVLTASCGVRQFNGRIFRSTSNAGPDTQAHAPFYAAGQGGNSMSTATCNSGVGRPCLRARASVGMPFHFDVNTNNDNGAIVVGTQYPPAPSAYPFGTSSIPGTSEATATRAGNYDLNLMQKQVGPGLVSF